MFKLMGVLKVALSTVAAVTGLFHMILAVQSGASLWVVFKIGIIYSLVASLARGILPGEYGPATFNATFRNQEA